MLRKHSSRELPVQSSMLLRSYRKAVTWSRLMLAAFFTVFAATIFWVMPWLPYGFESEDYDGQMVFMMLLVGLAAVSA
jgi:hypothetical protein